jgi:hypothetical protein
MWLILVFFGILYQVFQMIFSKYNTKLKKKYILLLILPPNNYRKIKHGLFESSWWDKLNGISFIFLSIIDVGLYYTTAFYIFIYYAILHFIIYSGFQKKCTKFF